jgi:hypothetical protein
MGVSQQDKDEMSKFLAILDGKKVPKTVYESNTPRPVELAGPGQTTQADVAAMANVLKSLNKISDNVVTQLVEDTKFDSETREAMITEKTDTGVKIGHYEINVFQANSRIAGKQYYQIVNSTTKEIIAQDISLYETARTVVKKLNQGKFVNHPEIRKLFEYDDIYSSQKVDALRFKKLMSQVNNEFKRDLYESRYQASVDRCMQAKKAVQKMAGC